MDKQAQTSTQTSTETDPLRRTRGEHCLNVYVSYEIKQQLRELAGRYDRTISDMVRAVLKVGIPMMQGLSEAEEVLVREYIDLFRRLRQVRSLKDI
jgi:predicted DNA-binding protein